MEIQLSFAITTHHGNLVIDDEPINISITSTVSHMLSVMKEKLAALLGHYDDYDLKLWKLPQPLPIGTGALYIAVENIQYHSVKDADMGVGDLKPLHRSCWISNYWTEQPEDSCVHFVVQLPEGVRREYAPTGISKGGHELVDADPATVKCLKYEEARQNDVQATHLDPSPSSAAVPPVLGHTQAKHPVLNGRPSNNYGPPVGLFHPVFNSFKAAVSSKAPLNADAAMYEHARNFLEASAAIYPLEGDRLAAIDPHMGNLIGHRMRGVVGYGVTSHGVILQELKDTTAAFVALREAKNEIGTASSDPYNQASFSYRKYWAGAEQKAIRERSYCPTIIIAIAGPWFCVMGGVFGERVIVQPLTDYMWLGVDPSSDQHLDNTVRLFAALKDAISTLQDYYAHLLDVEVPSPSGFPFIQGYGPGSENTFTYVESLVDTEKYPTKLIYKVRCDQSGKSLVVKFVSRYNALAHRLLAEHQLEPHLHDAGTEDSEASTYGGRYMIVMDFVNGGSLSALSTDQFDQVKEAVEVLHSNGYVFGDLQLSNILVANLGGKVKLVDFDWCNREDEGRYPANINVRDIPWPNGVRPGAPMKKQHDLDMLSRLR
ncbi:hypothetical protein BDN72DRAFT_903401 [Pluteus cervinus]|uniref:Uncharacterized protein n=1 Tax=Pluteus cervinus TaxID=181527 RepID=A0ACD3A9E8_9AGAR|nr:hypothetical protein BDN72DRAFT_903401 [Pluteus cervinus]